VELAHPTKHQRRRPEPWRMHAKPMPVGGTCIGACMCACVYAPHVLAHACVMCVWRLGHWCMNALVLL
jgi:hypothetical protein